VRFCGQKDNGKDTHKEFFPVYVGKNLSRKAFRNWVEKRRKRLDNDEEFEMEMGKWLRLHWRLLY
jgi:hypothetical protein